jgi:hypothetical protein
MKPSKAMALIFAIPTVRGRRTRHRSSRENQRAISYFPSTPNSPPWHKKRTVAALTSAPVKIVKMLLL